MNYLPLFLFTVSFLAFSCKPDESLVAPEPPETVLQVDTIYRTGELRLGTNVQLHWLGLDQDGYITGYQVSVDGDWTLTTRTDSLFSFSIAPGQDTADITITVAAMDNDGQSDPTPATLIVPIKNAPPQVVIDPEGALPDSAFIVITTDWRAFDTDGDETIEDVELKLNNGPWQSIGTQPGLLSFALSPNGRVGYYINGTLKDSLDGASTTDPNFLYMRAVDRAGIFSPVDTSKGFLWGHATEEVLLINGQPEYIGPQYKAWMDSTGISYDYLQMDAISGDGIPAYWTPTYDIIMAQYSKIGLFTDATQFPNNSGTDYLLNILTLSTQRYLQNGGKLLTCAQLSSGMSGGTFLEVFPVESLVTSVGQARLTNDSTLQPLFSGYPALRPQNIVLGITPIVPSADATALYDGQLTKIAGWNGTTTMGAVREQNGTVNQVFIALPLHHFTRPTQNGQELLNHIFNAVF